MINIVKEQNGGTLTVRLVGSIEESVNFDEMIGATSQELVVNTKEVSRINSVGVKGWIKYFQSLKAKGTQLRFVECSTAIVEQINLISNFTCGGTVESIYVPFACESCKSELVGLFRAADLKKSGMNIPSVKCTKCGGTAEFDDIPEEYLGFLDR